MVKLHDHNINDYLNSKYASDLDFSTDGSRIAFSIAGVYKNFKEEFGSDVAVITVKDGKQKLFSHEKWNNYSPKLNKSGGKLAYLSKKEEEYRLFIYDFEKNSGQEVVIERNKVKNCRKDPKGNYDISLKKSQRSLRGFTNNS